MAAPKFAPGYEWWDQGSPTTKQGDITEIAIMDSFSPEDTDEVIESWSAADYQSDALKCYIIGSKIIIAGNGSGKIYTNENASGFFWGFSSVSILTGMELLDTSLTTNFSQMFWGMTKMTAFDLSTMDTSNANTMFGMFFSCTSLKTIDIS